MNDERFESRKFLKLKYRRGDQIIKIFYKIGSPQKLGPPLFNLEKFQDSGRATDESCKMHWNLMNEEEIGSIKFLKLK